MTENSMALDFLVLAAAQSGASSTSAFYPRC